MLYDVALVDRNSGSVLATFIGVSYGVEGALIQLIKRARHNRSISLEVANALDVLVRKIYDEVHLDVSAYGYAIRSTSQVMSFQ